MHIFYGFQGWYLDTSVLRGGTLFLAEVTEFYYSALQSGLKAKVNVEENPCCGAPKHSTKLASFQRQLESTVLEVKQKDDRVLIFLAWH